MNIINYKIIQEKTSREILEEISNIIFGRIPEASSGVLSAENLCVILERTMVRILRGTSGGISEGIPERVLEEIPEGILIGLPEGILDGTCLEISEEIAKELPKIFQKNSTQEDFPKKMSKEFMKTEEGIHKEYLQISFARN